MTAEAVSVARVIAGLALAACTSSAAPPPCERSLEGLWRTGQVVDGEDLGYHFLERGGAAEGYPTFRDVPADLPPGVRAAPVAIDLVRKDGALTGRWSRRYELGGQRCLVSAPIRASRCVGRELVLELPPLPPPTDWSLCPKPGAKPATIAPAVTVKLHR